MKARNMQTGLIRAAWVRAKDTRAALLAVGVCLAAWQLVSIMHGPFLRILWDQFGLSSPVPHWAFLSSPWDILLTIPDEHVTVIKAFAETFWHTTLAAIVSFILGVALAEWLRQRGTLARSFHPLLQALNGVPPVTLLPIFLIAFGLDWDSVVAMAVFGATLSVLFIVLNASQQLQDDFPVMVSKLGYSQFGVWLWRLSSSSPYLLTAGQEGLRWSLILAVVAEMHGSTAGGLGAYIDSGRLNQQYAVVYIGILCCAVLSLLLHFTLNALGGWLHRRTVRALLAI